MALTIGELTGYLRADASHWERGMTRAGQSMAGLQRDAQGRLRDMNGRFVASGRTSGRSFVGSMLSTLTSGLRRGLGAAMNAGMSGLRGLSGALSSNPYVAAGGAALAAAIVAVALPAMAALFAASVISVAGLGVIGVAAMVLKEEPAVKKAASKLKDTVSSVLKQAAQPMEGALIEAMDALGRTARQVAPQLRKVFSTIAESGALKSLTDGFDQLVKNALPGFTAMLKGTRPVFEGLQVLMAEVGRGLSGFFREIGKAGPAAGLVVQDLGKALAGALIWGGKFIGWLARAYAAVRPWVAAFRDATAAVVATFQWLYDVLVGNSIIPDLVNAIVKWFVSLPGKILGGLGEFVGSVIAWFGRMKDRAVGATRDMVGSAVGWIAGLPGRAWTALRSLASNIASRAWDAGRRLVGAIRDKIGEAVDAVGGLPGKAKDALGNIGDKLWSSGRALVQGFIDGIWDKLGAVRDAASSVVSAARDYFPFSPARRGPFSGRGWTRYSGQSLIEDFQQGMAQQTPSLHRQMEQLMAALPMAGAEVSLAAAGAAGGPAGGVGGPLVSIGEYHAGGRSERQLAEDLYWLSKGRG